MRQFAFLLLILFDITVVSECKKIPLTDHILHYETLDYNVDSIKRSHTILKKSTPSSLSPSDRHIFISFYALGRNFTLDLIPNRDVFSSDAQFLVHTNNGVISSSYDPQTFYKGAIIGDPFSKVHGHIMDGVFDGEIVTGLKEKYHIEVADKYFKQRKQFHSVIYSIQDVLFHVEGKESGCATVKEELLKKMAILQASAKPVVNTRDDTLSSQFKKKQRLHKRTKTVTDGRICPIFVAADHFFVQKFGNENSAISEMTSIISSVQDIYLNSDFDEDGENDNIIPLIVKTELFTSSSHDGLFESSNIAVSDYLDRWSQINHDDFCLALLLTNRDFADGVLGLAWVGQPPGGSSGGICEQRVNLPIGERSLNTAIVTFLNYGQNQPRAVTTITIAHEFGHNFGSSHDPEGNAECSPGGSNGNYIMYARATDGNRANNDGFSPCSNSAIRQVIESKSSCFTATNAFCGNQIREGDEECDCGSSDIDQCAINDPCCEPGECMLKSTASCSSVDQCCDSTLCSFKPLNFECTAESECGEKSVCTGMSAVCPDQVNKNTTCNNGTRYCADAGCTGSVCLVLVPPRADCQCSQESDQCHVCCMINDTCTSTFTLASEGTLNTAGQYRESGRSCDNYRGYCSDDNMPICIGVDNEQTLNDLLDLFSLETLNTVVQWLKTYWWILIIVIVVIIIIILLLHFTYRKRKPIKKAARRASTSVGRRSSSSETAATTNDSSTRARERLTKENREKIERLKKFFPSCDSETIISVLRSCRTEEKTVRQLISIGFPMKKIPLPRL